jgi:hypothetical protein
MSRGFLITLRGDYAMQKYDAAITKASPTRDHKGEWVAHDGGPMPVDRGTQVEVNMFDGRLWRYSFCSIYWDHNRPQCDWIVAYRIIP